MDDEVLPDIDTGLIDVTGIDLAAMEVLDHSALARSLRRVIRLSEHAEEGIAGFNSAI